MKIRVAAFLKRAHLREEMVSTAEEITHNPSKTKSHYNIKMNAKIIIKTFCLITIHFNAILMLSVVLLGNIITRYYVYIFSDVNNGFYISVGFISMG